jgi:hypothetical protein
MAIIKGVKRIDITDLPSDTPEWVEYLLDPINGFMDTTITALRNNVNFDNLRRTLKKFTFTDQTELQISHNYKGRVGIEVLYCEDYYKIKTRQINNDTIGVTFKFDGAGSQEVTFAIVADIKV